MQITSRFVRPPLKWLKVPTRRFVLVNLIQAKCKDYRMDVTYPILFGVTDIDQGTQTPICPENPTCF